MGRAANTEKNCRDLQNLGETRRNRHTNVGEVRNVINLVMRRTELVNILVNNQTFCL